MYCAVEGYCGTLRHSSLNNDLLNGGVTLEMYNRVINMAIEYALQVLRHADTNGMVMGGYRGLDWR